MAADLHSPTTFMPTHQRILHTPPHATQNKQHGMQPFVLDSDGQFHPEPWLQRPHWQHLDFRLFGRVPWGAFPLPAHSSIRQSDGGDWKFCVCVARADEANLTCYFVHVYCAFGGGLEVRLWVVVERGPTTLHTWGGTDALRCPWKVKQRAAWEPQSNKERVCQNVLRWWCLLCCGVRPIYQGQALLRGLPFGCASTSKQRIGREVAPPPPQRAKPNPPQHKNHSPTTAQHECKVLAHLSCDGRTLLKNAGPKGVEDEALGPFLQQRRLLKLASGCKGKGPPGHAHGAPTPRRNTPSPVSSSLCPGRRVGGVPKTTRRPPTPIPAAGRAEACLQEGGG